MLKRLFEGLRLLKGWCSRSRMPVLQELHASHAEILAITQNTILAEAITATRHETALWDGDRTKVIFVDRPEDVVLVVTDTAKVRFVLWRGRSLLEALRTAMLVAELPRRLCPRRVLSRRR